MTKAMLIDAAHSEEVRVAVVQDGRVEEFDFESSSRKQLRGNIYLAKVTRVEPSLQAAFVEYGGNRHGFLAFSEIHPDYYQLPHEDREALIEEQKADAAAAEDDLDDDDETPRPRSSPSRRYKIQEVIRRRQVLLVQVVKEERGNKGAALTTFMSLAGRYCVLMPNTPRGGGISRKITNATDRKRLKSIVSEFEVPTGMGLIVRTAGAKRTKTEVRRDFDYLIRVWDKIKELTFSSKAPALIHEEGDLVQRAMRDLYDKDVQAVLVDGEQAYRDAKDLAKMLMPSHAKKVQLNKSGTPVFSAYRVETQLEDVFDPVVQLKSGGYLVIHQTEALVAIDVNSGKATRERSIENTALKTNMEAAEEACRQMRLRDLAGLIVIDFIDMEEGKNNRAVERKMKDCLKEDRARVQNGKISMFGLMEISRQRRRAGVLDSSSVPCDYCNGTGRVRSVESAGLQLMRALEARAFDLEEGRLTAEAPTDVVLFLLNEKRESLTQLEDQAGLNVRLIAKSDLRYGDFAITLDGEPLPEPKHVAPSGLARIEDLSDDEDEDDPVEETEVIEAEQKPSRGRRRRRRRGGEDRPSEETPSSLDIIDTDSDEAAGEGPIEDKDEDEDGQPRKRRRRGRRGGRRRRGGNEGAPAIELAEVSGTAPDDGGAVLDGVSLTAAEVVDADLVPEIDIVEDTPEPDVTEAETTPEIPTETEEPFPVAEVEAMEPVAEDTPPAKPVVVSETIEPDTTETVTPTVEVTEITVETTVAAPAPEPEEPAPSPKIEVTVVEVTPPVSDPVEVIADGTVDIPEDTPVEATETPAPVVETVEVAPKIEVVQVDVTPDDGATEVTDSDAEKGKRRGWWQRNKAG